MSVGKLSLSLSSLSYCESKLPGAVIPLYIAQNLILISPLWVCPALDQQTRESGSLLYNLCSLFSSHMLLYFQFSRLNRSDCFNPINLFTPTMSRNCGQATADGFAIHPCVSSHYHSLLVCSKQLECGEQLNLANPSSNTAFISLKVNTDQRTLISWLGWHLAFSIQKDHLKMLIIPVSPFYMFLWCQWLILHLNQ